MNDEAMNRRAARWVLERFACDFWSPEQIRAHVNRAYQSEEVDGPWRDEVLRLVAMHVAERHRVMA